MGKAQTGQKRTARDLVVLDDLGACPAIAEAECAVIEAFLGAALHEILREDRQAPSQPQVEVEAEAEAEAEAKEPNPAPIARQRPNDQPPSESVA